MGKGKVLGRLMRSTEGSVAIITAVGLVAFLGMVSLAIDMGQLGSARNELQNVADAAALAGANALIHDSGGVAVRDAAAAQQAAMTVAQRQSQLSGQPAVEDADRTDLTIIFGAWDIYAGNPSTAWTEIGSTCASNSNANAVKVTIRRASGTTYGPVSNLLGGVLGLNTSQIGATAIAYLGYAKEVPTATVKVPLALPGTGASSPFASSRKSGWFARNFGPREALATTTKTIVFKDTGGATVAPTVPTSPVASLDPAQGYFYTGAPNPSQNQVPNTIKNTLAKIYTPSLTGTSTVPVLVPDLKVGQEIYPASEYPWGRSYIGPIFQNLKKAYNFKTTGSTSTAPPAGTPWRVTLVVHGLKPTASQIQKGGFLPLARLLVPFWASEAYACSTVSYPKVVVSEFVNVDITGVTYNSTTSNDGNYTYPKTINGVTYTNKKDFLNRYPDSTWNLNTVTIKSVTDASTVIPAGPSGGSGALSGGPSNPGTSLGAFAGNAVLVK